MKSLIDKDPRNAERIFPYIGGEEVNNDPRHAHRRYVIDFGDMPLCRDHRERGWFLMTPEMQAKNLRDGSVPQDYPGPVAEDWPDLIDTVRRLVKPSRDKLKGNPDAERRRKNWWKWGRITPALNDVAKASTYKYLIARISPHFCFVGVKDNSIFSENIVVFPSNRISPFTSIQSRTHELWTRYFASTLEDRLRYTPSDCFETFPFPPNFETDPILEDAGRAYHNHRAQLMVSRNEGLTNTYNRFHNPSETADDIVRLRDLHDCMDHAVLRAYGWNDLIEESQPVFLDERNEDDHKYQDRYFWRADLRDEVLARLLDLNAERAAEERNQGFTPKSRIRPNDVKHVMEQT